MRWALIVVGALIGLVALCAVIGLMLPRDHVATMTTVIPAPPDSVWKTITDVGAYPTWRADLQTVEVLSQTPLAWREHGKQGALSFRAEDVGPPQRMVARITDQDQPFGGAWEYQLAADAGNAAHTRVTITERGWVSNPIFRFVSRFIIGHYSSIDGYLRALGRKYNSQAAPVRVS